MASGTSSPSLRIDFAGGAACSNRSCWFLQARSLSCSLLQLDRISDLIRPSESEPAPAVRPEESAELPAVQRARRAEQQARRAEQPQAPPVRVAEPLVE